MGGVLPTPGVERAAELRVGDFLVYRDAGYLQVRELTALRDWTADLVGFDARSATVHGRGEEPQLQARVIFYAGWETEFEVIRLDPTGDWQTRQLEQLAARLAGEMWSLRVRRFADLDDRRGVCGNELLLDLAAELGMEEWIGDPDRSAANWTVVRAEEILASAWPEVTA